MIFQWDFAGTKVIRIQESILSNTDEAQTFLQYKVLIFDIIKETFSEYKLTQMSTFSVTGMLLYKSTISGARYIGVVFRWS